MKKLLVIFLILFVLSVSHNFAYAQKDSIIDGDEMLVKTAKLLPAGWTMLGYDEVLVIQREEIVYVLFENRINAPESMETIEEINKRIIKEGKKTRAKYVFSYCPKLNQMEIETIKNQNDSIQRIINSLPVKYNIEYLLDKFASSKGGEYYTGKTDEEKSRIEAYYKEKRNLIDEQKKIPNYNSEKYSLYLNIIIGEGDELHLVNPYEVSAEIYKIREILNENLIKIR
jgi:hypothetical protein